MVKTGRIFLGLLFIFSAVSKLISLPFFDGMVSELFLGPDYYDQPGALLYIQIFTRLLISVELVLGVAVMQDRWFKKLVLPSVMLMLLLFTIHLFYEGFTSEKGFIEGNCGCFGDVLPMNNLESILKNVAAMIIGVFVWRKYETGKSLASWVPPTVLGVVTMATLSMTVKKYEAFTEPEVAVEENISGSLDDTLKIIGELPLDTASKDEDVAVVTQTPEPVKQEPVAADPEPVVQQAGPDEKTKKMLLQMGKLSDGSSMELNKGEVLVCMFSMTCGHCQEAYKEICGISQYAASKLPNIYLVNYGKEFEQSYFFNQAGNCKHAHVRTEDYTRFNRLLEGKGFPRMIAFKDGKIVKEWDIDTYNKEVFMKFYGIEEKKKEDGLIIQKKDDNSWEDDELEKNPWE